MDPGAASVLTEKQAGAGFITAAGQCRSGAEAFHRSFLVASPGCTRRTALCSIASGEAFACILGHAGLELLAQLGMVEVFTDQHQLVFALGG